MAEDKWEQLKQWLAEDYRFPAAVQQKMAELEAKPKKRRCCGWCRGDDCPPEWRQPQPDIYPACGWFSDRRKGDRRNGERTR